jgi:hypothetical protein
MFLTTRITILLLCFVYVFYISFWFVHKTAIWLWVRVRVMVFNATFNNVSDISCWSVLLAEEAGVPRENHRPAASHWQTSSHNVVSSTPHNVSGISTDCTGSYKFNYHTITATTPRDFIVISPLVCIFCFNSGLFFYVDWLTI